MTDITITMRLYGAFRSYQDCVSLSVPAGSPVAAIREALCRALGPQARDLVMDSVFANDTTILPSGFVIDADSTLSVLPPVCGG